MKEKILLEDKKKKCGRGINNNNLYIKIQCSCWLVGLSGFHAQTGRQIRTVYTSKELSRPRNEPRGGYFRIQPHPGGIKGGQKLPLKI